MSAPGWAPGVAFALLYFLGIKCKQMWNTGVGSLSLSVSLSLCLSVSLPVSLCLSVCLSLCLCLCACVCVLMLSGSGVISKLI